MDFREMAKKIFRELSESQPTEWHRAIEDSLRAAYSQGVEDAAKVAETTWSYIPQETWDEGFEPDYELTQKTAAERIRALKPPSEK